MCEEIGADDRRADTRTRLMANSKPDSKMEKLNRSALQMSTGFEQLHHPR